MGEINVSTQFLSTLPARGATAWQDGRRQVRHHFYPRSPRGERPEGAGLWAQDMFDFYPRSPRGERPQAGGQCGADGRFLSTLPARGATYTGCTCLRRRQISIHAPREGSDACRSLLFIRDMIFLSTLPARGATVRPLPPIVMEDISIHAPREGSDFSRPDKGPLREYISIHAPREGSDRVKELEARPIEVFLSTLPARGATVVAAVLVVRWVDFYPRSPRGERPGRFAGWLASPWHFYPRSPRGERRT